MSTPARKAFSPRESYGKKLLTVAVLALFVGSPFCPRTGAQILKSAPAGAPQKLFINILEGEGALNNIRQRDAREPVVQVTDENHKPVAGAAVLFLIHNGPHATATFNGAQTLSTTTGADGIAHATGLEAGTTPGSFTISVTASFTVAAAAAGVAATTLTVTTVIHQASVLSALSSSAAGGTAAGGTAGGTAGSTTATVATHGILHLSHTALIVAGSVAVAATVATVVAVTQGNNSTSLTLGSSTVGHP